MAQPGPHTRKIAKLKQIETKIVANRRVPPAVGSGRRSTTIASPASTQNIEGWDAIRSMDDRRMFHASEIVVTSSHDLHSLLSPRAFYTVSGTLARLALNRHGSSGRLAEV